MVRPTLSRRVIDVNRDPSGASLYPGQATTELCPTDDLRRRAALSRRRGARRGGDRAAPASVFRALSRGAGGRARRGCGDAHGASCSTTAIRSGRPFRACSTASCRSSTSAPMTARACDPALERAGRARSAPQAGGSHVVERPLQGRLDDPPLWPARETACTRSRWSSRCRGYLRRARSAAPRPTGRRRTTKPAPRRCAPHASPHPRSLPSTSPRGRP